MCQAHYIMILAPVVTALLFIVLLISGKKIKSELPPRLLLAFLGSILVFAAMMCAYQLDKFLFFAEYNCLYTAGLVLIHPLFYLYIISLFRNRITRLEYIINLSPAVIIPIVYYIIFIFSETSDIELFFSSYIKKGISSGTLTEFILDRYIIAAQLIHIVQGGVYFILIFRQLNQYHKMVESSFIETKRYKVTWLLPFVIIYGLGTLIGIIVNLLPVYVAQRSNLATDVSAVTLAVFSVYVGWYGLKQLSVGKEIEEQDSLYEPSTEDRGGAQVSEDFIIEKIASFFQDKKAYMNCELRIWDVVQATSINRTYISQAINKRYNITFSNYVNQFRVEEACRLIETRKNLSFESVAFESGFNSLSTFNRAFKVLKRQSPSEYKKSLDLAG